MTIVEAILAVMRGANAPMSATEVHDAIVKNQLYAFKAKQPVQIVQQQIRRHCVGVQKKTSSHTKYFAQAANGQFTALPQARTES
jgi:restriction system protein